MTTPVHLGTDQIRHAKKQLTLITTSDKIGWWCDFGNAFPSQSVGY